MSYQTATTFYSTEHKRGVFEECPGRSSPYNESEWGLRNSKRTKQKHTINIVYMTCAVHYESSEVM